MLTPAKSIANSCQKDNDTNNSMGKPTKVLFEPKIIGPASLLTIGVLFGISGVMAKYLSGPLNAYQVVEYRFGIALLGALLILVVLKQRLSFGGVDKKVLGLFAVTFPISVVLFTLSIFNGPVALAVFSFYTATLISSFVLGRLFFREKIDLPKQLAFVAMLVAIFAFTDPLNNFTLSFGLVFGLLSGLVQGVASSFQKALGASTNTTSLLVVQCLAGLVLAAGILTVTGEPLVAGLSRFEWLVTIAFGLAMLAITYLFLVGFKYTNLNTGSILVSSELFFGPLFAYLLLAENLPANILFGGAFTILAAVLAHLPAKTKPDGLTPEQVA
jgi:drug/metabolite transporter (DMT)-like permease